MSRLMDQANNISDKTIAIRAINSFEVFVKYIFSASFEEFIAGDYIWEVVKFYTGYRHTMRVSARDHFKSTSMYAFVMWRIWQLMVSKKNIEAHYFSYNHDMSAYHIKKIKDLIHRNLWFGDMIDLKVKAESALKVFWNGNPNSVYTLEPKGLLTFKRGIHCDDIYVDDPLRDPENKMLPTVIKKVNDIFVKELLSMPHKDTGIVHAVGTPQTNFDFFFDKKLRLENGGSFKIMISPAVISYEKKIQLWPEYWSWERLMEKKNALGIKNFNQEFMCSPVYSEDAYLNEKELRSRVNPKLSNINIWTEKSKEHIKNLDIIGGWDIGKKAHPSHFVVYTRDETNHWIQRLNVWMDNWDYNNSTGKYDPKKPTQLEYISTSIKNLGIDTIYYDATRGELEALRENGQLPTELKPVIFNIKTMSSMANSLQEKIADGRIELIDDERQISQMLMVNNDLQSLESPEGHADSFWSNALALSHKESVRTFSSKPRGW